MKCLLVYCIFFVFLNIGFTFAQNLSSDQFKAGDIVDKKYEAFGLGEYQKGQERAYYVKIVGNIANSQLICFTRDLGSTAVMNQEEIELFLLKDGKIIDKRHEVFGREKKPEFVLIHDCFIQYIEQKHNWFENEMGAMTYNPDEDFTDGLRYVVKDEKIVPLAELSKADLRIYRNLIFAKYGYIFKSEDLNAYFEATNWYKPNREIKVEQVMNETDKELANFILKLESKKITEKHLQDSIASLKEIAEITWNDDKHGYIVDPRDKMKYMVVNIGNQIWMAENIAYKPGAGNYWAYSNNQINAAKYGYLYDWETAKTICPAGWHLPKNDEWSELTNFLGSTDLTAAQLRSTKGWQNANSAASNETGFTALPGGYRNYDGKFYDIGSSSTWWNSNDDGRESAWVCRIDGKYNSVNSLFLDKNSGFYVRCIRD